MRQMGGRRIPTDCAASVSSVWPKPSQSSAITTPGAFAATTAETVSSATLVGIARAASADAARTVAECRRNYSHAAASRSSADPQVLQAVGRVHSLTYAAGAVMLKAAEALERSFEHRDHADLKEAANINAEIEIAQAQTTISALVLKQPRRSLTRLAPPPPAFRKALTVIGVTPAPSPRTTLESTRTALRGTSS
jgi:hypothetical protein